jgi:acetylornithine/succinyldiaminopimelate/putrescine aminotransferase
MKSTSIRTAAAAGAVVFAALTVGTAVGHADAKDDAFVASLQKLGMKVEDTSMARSLGLMICGDLGTGKSADQIAQDFEQNGPAIVAAAKAAYCP